METHPGCYSCDSAGLFSSGIWDKQSTATFCFPALQRNTTLYSSRAKAHLIYLALLGTASVKNVIGLWSVYMVTTFPKIQLQNFFKD